MNYQKSIPFPSFPCPAPSLTYTCTDENQISTTEYSIRLQDLTWGQCTGEKRTKLFLTQLVNSSVCSLQEHPRSLLALVLGLFEMQNWCKKVQQFWMLVWCDVSGLTASRSQFFLIIRGWTSASALFGSRNLHGYQKQLIIWIPKVIYKSNYLPW